MTTPPDGQPPKMQMYLFRDTNSPTALDFRSVNGGDDSGLVWHEYTHGLSNRLVTNADGSGALSSAHSGAMGEGWSDWYASDLQVRDGLKTDAAGTPGEIDIGDYTDADLHKLRSQALDCPVNTADPLCPGGVDTAAGGYTLGDFGKIFEGPEVHADGELWAETLWDLRQAVGSDVAERLVTNGMRLSPPEPSMLDMRNSILAAEQANGGGLHDEVWEVFRVRGMGYRAAVSDGNDTEPVEDFTLPPDPAGPKGTTTGVVTDSDSGLPLAGVRVGFGGHASQPDFDDYLADETDSRGRYTISDVPVGSYPKLAFFASAGYDTAVLRDVSVTAGATTTHNLRMTRDWAALGGGAVLGAISDNTGDGVRLRRGQGVRPVAGDRVVLVQPGRPRDAAAVRRPADGRARAAAGGRRHVVPHRSQGRLRQRRDVEHPRVHDRDLGERDGLPDRRRRQGCRRVHRRQPRPAEQARAHGHHRPRRAVHPGRACSARCRQAAECLPQTCTGTDYIDLAELKVLGGDPNHAAVGPAQREQPQPDAGRARHLRRDGGHGPGLGDHRLRLGLRRQRVGGPHAPRRRRRASPTAPPGPSTPWSTVKDFRGGQGTATTPVTVTAPTPAPPVGARPAARAGPAAVAQPARARHGRH